MLLKILPNRDGPKERLLKVDASEMFLKGDSVTSREFGKVILLKIDEETRMKELKSFGTFGSGSDGENEEK